MAREQAPFELQVTQAGAFPSAKAPRVIWLGLGGDLIPLARMYHKLEKAFAALGHLPRTPAMRAIASARCASTSASPTR